MKMFLLLDPPTATAQERQVTVVKNRPIFYQPEKLKEAKNILRHHLRPFKPKEPLTGALELHVVWLFPRGRRHKHKEWRVTKPDTDNLQKMLKDVMTDLGFWNDDAQVVKEHVEKLWCDEPTGIDIEIIELPKIKEG
ncbi:MAG TPA: RusA family crossover junction endodeoxyribonuclease [Bacilli bacterium]|jgi:crossover junction endodeoxyribonuclease RusA|nr:RusA family crossover junction endodeoxyribonuclease [Bacilli bacterium]